MWGVRVDAYFQLAFKRCECPIDDPEPLIQLGTVLIVMSVKAAKLSKEEIPLSAKGGT